MNPDCLFCQIAADPTKLKWENSVAAAFADLHPQAPVHWLVVPKRHAVNIDDLDDSPEAGKLLMAVREAAHAAGLQGRWKLQVNNGRSAGQIVDHLHFHIMGQASK